MSTEITDKEKVKGWVLYDAHCPWCLRLAGWFEKGLTSRHFKLVPLQAPWVHARLGMTEAELLTEIRLLQADGRAFGGAEALLEISRHYRLAWPVRQLARVPVVLRGFRALYRWVARMRPCADGACALNPPANNRRNHWLADLLPLTLLMMLALLTRAMVPAWVFMWAMAFGMFGGCKWLTYREARRRDPAIGRARKWAYLLAWPGMGAAAFLGRKIIPAKPTRTEWVWAFGKTMLGAGLLWGAVRTALPAYPLLAGWIGMIGAILVLHFGTFDLIALGWRQSGVNAVPIMQNPLHAKSLAEFWGGRWNAAFNELAFGHAYRPLRRLTTPAVAMLLVFGLSGIIHELVISLPARGGYGLPTAYFLLQGLGLMLERSRFGCWLGLGQGGRGWLFTVGITAGPAFWLFHPQFIKNVILPMLQAIGAI